MSSDPTRNYHPTRPTLEQLADCPEGMGWTVVDRDAVLAREIIALRTFMETITGIGLTRPPEEVFAFFRRLHGIDSALESAPTRGEATRMVNIYERYVEIRAERDALQQQLADARAALADAKNALVDITCVGITILSHPYRTKEAKMRNIACHGIHGVNEALAAPDADGSDG